MVMLAWDGGALVDNKNWLNKKIMKKGKFCPVGRSEFSVCFEEKLATGAGKLAGGLVRYVVFLLG